MSDDWFCPGGAVVAPGKRIHIVPPRTWRRFELAFHVVPPSMNTNEIRSHWSGFQRQKKNWQEHIEMLLMMEHVKRDGYQRAIAGAFLRFPFPKVRDTNNFTTLLNKALGDALGRDSKGRGYGAIPDDDERRYYFGGVEFEDDPGPPRTRIVLFLQPKEG